MPIEELTEYWDPFSMHTHTETPNMKPSMLLLNISIGILNFNLSLNLQNIPQVFSDSGTVKVIKECL